MNTPHSKVKSQFESKEKLVAAVQALATEELWLNRLSSDRGQGKGLEHVSNAKLLRLHQTLSAVKDQFGSRAKLIDAVLELDGRAKDAGYRTRLEGYPVPRLYDLFRSKSRGKKAPAKAEKAPEKAAKAEAAAKKKPAAKKTAAKKSAKKSDE